MIDAEDVSADEAAAGPLPARIGRVAVMVVVTVLVVYVFVRLVSPAVQPDQRAPKAHVPGTCSWCHTVSEKAEPIKVDK